MWTDRTVCYHYRHRAPAALNFPALKASTPPDFNRLPPWPKTQNNRVTGSRRLAGARTGAMADGESSYRVRYPTPLQPAPELPPLGRQRRSSVPADELLPGVNNS